MAPAKGTSIVLIISLFMFLQAGTVCAYNPFVPDYGEGWVPDSGLDTDLSAIGADRVLTGKITGHSLRTTSTSPT